MCKETIRVLLELRGAASRDYGRKFVHETDVIDPDSLRVGSLQNLCSTAKVWRSEGRRPAGRLRSVAGKEVRPIRE